MPAASDTLRAPHAHPDFARQPTGDAQSFQRFERPLLVLSCDAHRHAPGKSQHHGCRSHGKVHARPRSFEPSTKVHAKAGTWLSAPRHQIYANRRTVSGNRCASRMSNAACALGFARPCSQFSSVRTFVRRYPAKTPRDRFGLAVLRRRTGSSPNRTECCLSAEIPVDRCGSRCLLELRASHERDLRWRGVILRAPALERGANRPPGHSSRPRATVVKAKEFSPDSRSADKRVLAAARFDHAALLVARK